MLVTVTEHPQLRREGTTIHSSVSVAYTDAILGTTVSVPTVDGSVSLKIPAGTQPGSTLVMAKKGVPRLGQRDVRGDHLVKVQVTIPRHLSDKERDLVKELAEESKAGGDKKAKAGWFG